MKQRLKKSLNRAVILALAVFSSSNLMAEDTMVVSVQRLTMEAAQNVATGVIHACRKQGVQVTATIVDKNGIVQAVARDTLAPPISLDISREKAFTAANFSVDTSSLTELAKSPVGSVDQLTMSAGGIVIEAGGVVYGAVGVSGAPSGELDEACAREGLQDLLDELEMMD